MKRDQNKTPGKSKPALNPKQNGKAPNVKLLRFNAGVIEFMNNC